MRSLEVPPGQQTRVFRRRLSSLPLTVTLRAKPLRHGDPVGGIVERVGSRWIFGRTRSTVPLAGHVVVMKGFWDTFFDVLVTPDVPVVLDVESPRMRNRAAIWGLAAIVVSAVIAITVLALVR